MDQDLSAHPGLPKTKKLIKIRCRGLSVKEESVRIMKSVEHWTNLVHISNTKFKRNSFSRFGSVVRGLMNIISPLFHVRNIPISNTYGMILLAQFQNCVRTFVTLQVCPPPLPGQWRQMLTEGGAGLYINMELDYPRHLLRQLSAMPTTTNGMAILPGKNREHARPETCSLCGIRQGPQVCLL
jgi:hypothetical protein